MLSVSKEPEQNRAAANGLRLRRRWVSIYPFNEREKRMTKEIYQPYKNINERLNELRPQLEVFFGNALASDFEKAKFLKYDPGDFFAPHTDAQYRRKINITINLNTSINATGELNFEGGELQLYGLIKKPEFTNKGISAPSTAGCLIAYPVDVVHEVTPIKSGTRFSIVSRFLSE